MSGSRCARPKDAATAPDALPPADVPQFTVGETVRMRKAHPCGADAWTVTRVGGDVGLRCAGCGRRIFLARRELARRLHPPRSAGAANSV